MTLIFDTRLGAAEILRSEGCEVADIHDVGIQKRSPVRICILNLLADKPAAEVQWLRGLSYAECDAEVSFFMVESYKPKHTPQAYLDMFYKTTTQIMNERYDGLIITGADAEKYRFRNCAYWPELERIFDWADRHVTGTLFSCWSAMAASYHYYGIDKVMTGSKISGVYPHRMPHPEHLLMRGIKEPVLIPHSRISKPEEEKVFSRLTVLAENGWPAVYCDNQKKRVFLLGHWEYEPYVLRDQYVRDTSKGFDVKEPENYFDQDGNILTDSDWADPFHLLMRNWVRWIQCR